MTPEVTAKVRKARRSLDAARQLADAGHQDFAVSRAYFAMFYPAEALLLTRGLTFAKHGQVIGAFGKEFVKSGVIAAEHHASLRLGFDARAAGDYDVEEVTSPETAAQVISAATAFVEACVDVLKSR